MPEHMETDTPQGYHAWIETLNDSDLEDEYNDRYSDQEDEGWRFDLVDKEKQRRMATGRYMDDVY